MSVVDPIAEMRAAMTTPTFDERVWSESSRDEREAILQRGDHHRPVSLGYRSEYAQTPSGRFVRLIDWVDMGVADAALEWSEMDDGTRNAAIRGIRSFMDWAEGVAGE